MGNNWFGRDSLPKTNLVVFSRCSLVKNYKATKPLITKAAFYVGGCSLNKEGVTAIDEPLSNRQLCRQPADILVWWTKLDTNSNFPIHMVMRI